jgi:hypothetical protein
MGEFETYDTFRGGLEKSGSKPFGVDELVSGSPYTKPKSTVLQPVFALMGL